MPPKLVPNVNPYAAESDAPAGDLPTSLTFEPETVDVRNEGQVRADPSVISGAMSPDMVYGQAPQGADRGYYRSKGQAQQFLSGMGVDASDQGLERRNRDILREPVNKVRKMAAQGLAQSADDDYTFLAHLMKLYPSQEPSQILRQAQELRPLSTENQASKEVEDMAISEQLQWLQTIFDARQGAKPGIGTLKKLEVRPSPSAPGTSTPAPSFPRTTDSPNSSTTFAPGGSVGLRGPRRSY